MKTYRLAILGCRARGTTTAQAYDAHPRTEVVALCDLLRERLDILGDELGVKARFVDLDEMIEQTRPDIVGVYDLSGRQITLISDAKATAGRQTLSWDGRDEQDHIVAPGLYILRVSVEGDALTRTENRLISVVY